MRPFLVVIPHPRIDGLSGSKPVLESMQVDALVLERAPEAFDEDVVHPPTLPSMEIRTPASLSTSVSRRW